MEQIYVQKIEQLLKYCPEGSKCHKQKVENLCKAEDVGLESFLQCLEKAPFECTSALSYDGSYYCACRPRVYIAKAFKV
jgi:hypothetical protein